MNKIKFEEIQDLIGEQVIYKNQVKEITGIHIYLNKKGIKGVRLHLNGIDGYIKLEDAIFFEVVKFGGRS